MKNLIRGPYYAHVIIKCKQSILLVEKQRWVLFSAVNVNFVKLTLTR